MKRRVIVLLAALLCNALYAQNSQDILSITKEKLDWKSPHVVCSQDTVCIGFGNSVRIEFKTQCNKNFTRRDLNEKLKFNIETKIVVQPGKDGGSFISAGHLVRRDNKEDYPGAKLIVRAVDCPMKWTFNKDTITIVGFDSNDSSLCEFVRKHASAYTLPPVKKDTVTINDISDYKLPLIKIPSSSFWRIDTRYFIKNDSIKTNTSDTLFFSDAFPSLKKDIKKTKKDSLLVVSYTMSCQHDYFGHERRGTIAEVYVKQSDSRWSWKYLWYSVLVLILAGIICNQHNLRSIFIKRRQSRKVLIQQDYIDYIESNKGSDEKKSIIYKLLSNEDIEFKTQIAQSLGVEAPIETRDNETATLKTTIAQKNSEISKLSEDTIQLQEEKSLIESERDSLKKQSESLSLQVSNWRRDNEALQGRISSLVETVNRLRLEINDYKCRVSQKDSLIEQLSTKLQALIEQLARISRQSMYVHQIDDALKDVSESIIKAFSSVHEGELNKKLVVPLLNGVSGLDEGMTGYYSRWQNQVVSRQHDFFGKELYDMSDDEVKKKLVSGFLKTIAQGDTFSKLTRLYMYIQADWINDILIETGFNVNEVERIFNRLKLLFDDFGIEIVYPRLFVDHMNEQKYSFDPRCEVFKLFPVSEELRASISKQHDLIIDIIQIGIVIPSEQYSRKAIVSIPSF